MTIEGGYYLKARKIQDSEIAHAPPHVREIWDWLLKEANHKDNSVCKRGECVRSYKDIQEGLHWYAGWRKMTYSKNDCETSMKWLTAHTMIHTRKTTRGLHISIVNYAKYQDPSAYEKDKESYRAHTRLIQSADTINKNEKNERMEEPPIVPLSGEKPERWTDEEIQKRLDAKLKPYLEGDYAHYAGNGRWRVCTHSGEWMDYAGSIIQNLTWK